MIKTIKQIAILPLVFLIIVSTQALASAAPLRIAVSGPYAPFAFYDDDNVLSGFDVEIAKALCEQINQECEVINLDFDALLPSIVSGEIDLVVAGLGASDSRKAIVDFTDRYYRSISIYIVKEENVTEDKEANVIGKRVAAQTNSLQVAYLEKTYGDKITLIKEPEYKTLFQMLKDDKVDFVLSDGLPGYEFLLTDDGSTLDVYGPPVAPEDVMSWSCIAIAKGRDDLREKINKAITEIRENGVYSKINRKFFNFAIY